MAFTGIGSTMLGPFLPRLSSLWRLHDHQAGMLVSCLFLGSFSGTIFLSRRLERSLQRGAWTACLGCLLFAWSAQRDSGFVCGGLALIILGFGMGQLMSSLNLLVGAAPERERYAELANLGAAWCIGAVLSPCLTTVVFIWVSSSLRLGLFAPLYLLPLLGASGSLSAQPHVTKREGVERGMGELERKLAFLCMVIFLLYGGIEASVGGWLPLFATRYCRDSLAVAQWIVSLFWLGLIVGRVLTAKFVSYEREPSVLRTAISSSAFCLLWFYLFPSSLGLSIGSYVLGMCLSPIFPLLLSATIACGFTTRVMGLVLAACALGAAVLPLLLGILSSLSSLRTGMLLPLLGLFLLLLLRHPLQHSDSIA